MPRRSAVPELNRNIPSSATGSSTKPVRGSVPSDSLPGAWAVVPAVSPGTVWAGAEPVSFEPPVCEALSPPSAAAVAPAAAVLPLEGIHVLVVAGALRQDGRGHGER